MKTKNLSYRMAAMMTALACLTFGSVGQAQAYSVLHSFGVLTNVTGRNPRAALAQAPDGTLYGTTSSGEGAVVGTVFKLNSDGTGFTVLKWFTNSLEGAAPYCALVLSGSTLFGTTAGGGSSNHGTVFKVNTDGSDYTVLKHFAGFPSDGANPRAGLTLSGSTLFGTTQSGGSSGSGTVFKVNTNGSGFTVLKNFTGSDGRYPVADLTLAGSTVYGTTIRGGSFNYGTVFQVNTDGTDYSVRKEFDGNDGRGPERLTLSGSTLYGTTSYGGGSGFPGYGTVFQVNTDGSGFTVLLNFTSSVGAYPNAGTLSGSTLYGTTEQGGSSNRGTVFQVNTDGTGYTVLKNFTGSDGAHSSAGLTLSGSTLYGTTAGGGGLGVGVVFSLSLQPLLTLALSGANVILTWPTTLTGFTLQSTTNLVSAA